MASSTLRTQRTGRLLRTFRASLLCLPALLGAAFVQAAPGLRALTGTIGGPGTGDIGAGCTTYGSPRAVLDWFGSGLGVAVPGGGISACGYAGQVIDHTSPTGSASANTAVGPVILGNPGYAGDYTGSASAQATFGGLHAKAGGAYSGGLPGSPVALSDASAAAWMTDELTLTSPQVVPASAGYVGYRFQIDGSLTAAGAPMPYYFGETLASLVLQHRGGPIYEAAHFYTRRGEPGSATSVGVPLSGWTGGTGSVAGSGALNTMDTWLGVFPIVFGTSWEMTLGLAVRAYGESAADFGSTARLIGVDVFDAAGQRITDFTLTSASGTDYTVAIPEPATGLLLLAGVGVLALGRRVRSRTWLP